MIKFVDQHGIIRNKLDNNPSYERIKAIGQCIANRENVSVRAIKGGLTKIATFHPECTK